MKQVRKAALVSIGALGTVFLVVLVFGANESVVNGLKLVGGLGVGSGLVGLTWQYRVRKQEGEQ